MATEVMVSFPKELLAEVDRVAREEHRSWCAREGCPAHRSS